MAEYDNKNTAVLFKNDRKSEDRHPDYTGTLTLPDGTECFLDAWMREGKKGKYFSMRFKPKGQRKEAGNAVPFEDPMPF